MSVPQTYGDRAFENIKRCGWRWSMEPPAVVWRTTFHPVVAPNAFQRLMQRWLLGIYWDKP